MVKAFPVGLKPNLYELTDALHGDGVVVSYATAGLDGKPQFIYRDAFISRSFTGDNIRVNETEIGALVTVQIQIPIDPGSPGTDFTLVLPRVNLRLFESTSITTIGVRTVHRTSPIGEPHGQVDMYSTVNLTGSAMFFEA
jgi:hypothetical protein